MNKLIPNKNHKKFLKELCLLIKDYEKISDFRNKEEITMMLSDRLPKILNNFDKNDPVYPALATLLIDIFKNMGVVIKFIKHGNEQL